MFYKGAGTPQLPLLSGSGSWCWCWPSSLRPPVFLHAWSGSWDGNSCQELSILTKVTLLLRFRKTWPRVWTFKLVISPCLENWELEPWHRHLSLTGPRSSTKTRLCRKSSDAPQPAGGAHPNRSHKPQLKSWSLDLRQQSRESCFCH